MRERLTILHTQSLTAEREWMVDGIPVLSAAVDLPLPVSAADRVSRRIRRYYTLQCRSFLRYCEHWLLPAAQAEYHAALAISAPLPVFRAELTHCVTCNQNGVWSLYTQSREKTLPGRTLLTRWGDTWDLAAGYPMELSSLFPSRSPWRRQLLRYAAAEIERQEAAGMAQYHDGWRRLLRRSFNPRHYYLTEDGLVFFFPMYAIAPAAEGIPSFLLPYGAAGLCSPFPESNA